MLSYWCTEFKLGVDFEKCLKLSGSRRAMYRQMAKPLGEATIRKGGFLSHEEYTRVLKPVKPSGRRR